MKRSADTAGDDRPWIDDRRLAILWRDRACELASRPVLLGIARALLAAEGAYLRWNRLVEDAGLDPMTSGEAFRMSLSRLRAALTAAGMARLAAGIQGSKAGAY